MSEAPVVLRHRDSLRQSAMFGAFAAVLWLIPALAFIFDHKAKWGLIALVPFGLLTGYFAFRLLTARVVLDARGLNEPAPFRPTVVTPWSDLVRVRRTEDVRGGRLTFLGVGVEHQGGWKHQVVALNINNRDPRGEKTIEEWLVAIREAKRRFGS